MATVKSVEPGNNSFGKITLSDVDLNFTVEIFEICPGSDFIII